MEGTSDKDMFLSPAERCNASRRNPPQHHHHHLHGPSSQPSAPSETSHLTAASAQTGSSRLETTELSPALCLWSWEDKKGGEKKPTPVSAALLLTHHDVLWAGGMSLSLPRSGAGRRAGGRLSVSHPSVPAKKATLRGRRRPQHENQSDRQSAIQRWLDGWVVMVAGGPNTVSAAAVIRDRLQYQRPCTGWLHSPMSLFTPLNCFPNVL